MTKYKGKGLRCTRIVAPGASIENKKDYESRPRVNKKWKNYNFWSYKFDL